MYFYFDFLGGDNQPKKWIGLPKIFSKKKKKMNPMQNVRDHEFSSRAFETYSTDKIWNFMYVLLYTKQK